MVAEVEAEAATTTTTTQIDRRVPWQREKSQATSGVAKTTTTSLKTRRASAKVCFSAVSGLV